MILKFTAYINNNDCTIRVLCTCLAEIYDKNIIFCTLSTSLGDFCWVAFRGRVRKMVWRTSKSSNPSHKFVSNKQERYKELTLLFKVHHGKKKPIMQI